MRLGGFALVLQILEVQHVIRVGREVQQLLLDLVLVRQLVDRVIHFRLVVGLHGRVFEQFADLLLHGLAVDDVVHVGRGQFGLLVIELAPGGVERALGFFVAGDAVAILVGGLGFQGADQLGPRVILGNRAVFDAGAVGVDQLGGGQFADAQGWRLVVFFIGVHAGVHVQHIQVTGLGQVVLRAGVIDCTGTEGVPLGLDVVVELRAQLLGDDDFAFAGLVADQAIAQFIGRAEGDVGVFQEVIRPGQLVAFAFAGVDFVPGVMRGGDAFEQLGADIRGHHHLGAVMEFVGEDAVFLVVVPTERLVVIQARHWRVGVGQCRAVIQFAFHHGLLARVGIDLVQAGQVVEQLGVVITGHDHFLAVAFEADQPRADFIDRADGGATIRRPHFVIAGALVAGVFAAGEAGETRIVVLGFLEGFGVVTLADNDLGAVLGFIADHAGAGFIRRAEGFVIGEFFRCLAVRAQALVTGVLAGNHTGEGLEVCADLLEQVRAVVLADDDLLAVLGLVTNQPRANFIRRADGLVVRQRRWRRGVLGRQCVALLLAGIEPRWRLVLGLDFFACTVFE